MKDISKYSSLFHDGSVIYMNHVNNELIISMESAEVDEEDIEDDVVLSQDDRIRGKLHIKGIKNIIINNTDFFGIIKNTYDDGSIVNFKVTKNFVRLSIDWVNFPPKPKIDEFSVIQIEAEKVWWENIPDLVEP